MKPLYLILTILSLCATATTGQTLEEARKLYNEGQYALAKPVMRKYAKAQPSNGNYNLWYGVCLLRTGEPEKAVKPLEVAVKKRITGGRLYLGQAYHAVYRFDDAVQTFEDYVADLTRLKRSTRVADSLLARAKIGQRMMRGVEQVCFIDSVVVPKAHFLRAYRLSPGAGRLHERASFPAVDGQAVGETVYESEMGNKIYYAVAEPDSTTGLRISDKTPSGWSEGRELPGLDRAGEEADYPYVSSDGLTLYYAARGSNSLGGYDIFVTRYHPARGAYLTPENVGMPFNSPANDYMYAIDEETGLGWLASDRHQPADSVCIYIFLPNTAKHVYNQESTDGAALRRLARLHAIGETWTDSLVVAEARAKLAGMTQASPTAESKPEFEFIVNDRLVYHHTSDFRSREALETFRIYRQLQSTYAEKAASLAGQREAFARADDDRRRQMAPAMTDLEKHLTRLQDDIDRAAREVRRMELSNPSDISY